jgi:L-fucose isomerase-like protein
VSSVLHDAAAVEKIFSGFEGLLHERGGKKVETLDSAGFPPFFFILTGGTEGQVKEFLRKAVRSDGRLHPLTLLAHPGHNSLPAALEIAAWAVQQGGTAKLVQIGSPDDARGHEALDEAIRLDAIGRAMRATRIGAVGTASEWLVASSQGADAAARTWGCELVSVSLDELYQGMGTSRKEPSEKRRAAAKEFLEQASFCSEPSDEDLARSDSILDSLAAIVLSHRLDALTLRCFDLVTGDGSTGCYALSRLADEGIEAGCEGDIPSILALRWMRLLSGRPAWMANPSRIDRGASEGRARIHLAHCTVPRSMLTGYGIRSHFESGLGLAIAGSFEPGPVTLVRIGGSGLEKAWVAEGMLIDSPHAEGLCRTQAVVELDEASIEAYLSEPLGNHFVMGLGHHGRLAKAYSAREKIRIL